LYNILINDTQVNQLKYNTNTDRQYKDKNVSQTGGKGFKSNPHQLSRPIKSRNNEKTSRPLFPVYSIKHFDIINQPLYYLRSESKPSILSLVYYYFEGVGVLTGKNQFGTPIRTEPPTFY